MDISGIQKTSLIDFPKRVSTTVFTQGCNFRCPFCHNPELVTGKVNSIPDSEFFDFLKKRQKLLDGVCITGGEPTLIPDLKEFILKIKEFDLDVKLDTNGTKPDMIKELLPYLDYIAMDIKSDKENYNKTAGLKVDIDKIKESIKLIQNSDVEYEFRTTVVKGHFDNKIAQNIATFLKGSKKYVLQQFINDNNMIDNSYKEVSPYTPDELKEFSKILKQTIDNVEIRGI